MNTYIYEIDGGYVMVDTGYEKSYENVLNRLKRHSIDPSKIKYVFLTHAHDDHAGFLKELLDDHPNISVVMSEKAMPVLQAGQNSFEGGCSGLVSWLFCRLLKLMGKGAHRFPPLDDTYRNRFIVLSRENQPHVERALDGKVLFTPGHTDDSISLMIDDLIFCGDAAMNGIPSRNRITIWIGNREAYSRSWEALLSTGAKMLLPAHGKRFPLSDLKEHVLDIDNVRLYPLKP